MDQTSNQRTAFLNAGGFTYSVQVGAVRCTPGLMHLRITSRWADARDPLAERKVLDVTLDASEFDAFVAALQAGRDRAAQCAVAESSATASKGTRLATMFRVSSPGIARSAVTRQSMNVPMDAAAGSLHCVRDDGKDVQWRQRGEPDEGRPSGRSDGPSCVS